jgi:class 3 adenylate cyclase
MPLYMDRHYIEGATRRAVADAHDMDLDIQDKYHVTFRTYWFDEERSTAFCLVESPDKETLQAAHNEAHGLVPHEIVEVDPGIVAAFLGRVADPTPVDTNESLADLIDGAFRAIMFTDLEGSTLMTTTFGDSHALHLLHVHNAITRNALREAGGQEVKHTGDGIMASFADVPQAVLCAIAIQRAFAEHNRQHPGEEIHLRIGISAGEPIEEDGDFFGNTVQLAARLCAHAGADQILVPDEVHALCQDVELSFSEAGEFVPKGFEQPVRVYIVNWQPA